MSDMAENMKQAKSAQDIVAVNKPTLQQAVKQYKKSPFAMPGILSGVFLGIGRIVGESAALMFTSGTVAQVAVNPMDSGRTLAVHMYNLLNEGLAREAAYATAVILLILVVGINALSSFVAKKFSKA